MSNPAPQPFNEDIASRGGYLYTTDAPLSSRLAHAHISEIVLELGDLAGKRVIDIGCGDGTYSVELLRSGAASVHGVDPAEAAVGVARDRAEGLAATFEVGDAGALPFDDRSFDLAQIRAVLHHMESPLDAVREALRVASLVVIAEPNGHNPGLKLLERVSRYHREHGERSYSRRRLDGWVEAAGGRIVERRWIGFVPTFSPDWYARAAKRIEPGLEAVPGLRSILCAHYVFSASA